LNTVIKEIWEYEQVTTVQFWDVAILPLLVLIIFLIGSYRKIKNIHKYPEYQYYMLGLYARMFGVVVFCLIYIYYYGGGDTLAYFESSMAMANLFYKDPESYFKVLFSAPTQEIRSLFDDTTGYPYSYLFYDSKTFMVIRLISPLTILTNKSYLLTSILVSFITYGGVWRLYRLFYRYYPEIKSRLAFAVLYFPSLLFWGTGILKDTFTMYGTALVVYYTHQVFIIKKKTIGNIIMLLIGLFLIIKIKPYIFMVLFPGTLLWIFYNRIIKLRNGFIIMLFMPMLIFGLGLLSYVVLMSLGDSLDKFSLDNALKTAAEAQMDLKQAYYGGASFDIGNYDGTIPGAFRLFPAATIAGLFRPFIWEGGSVVLLLAGIENFLILFFTIYILFKTRIIYAIKLIVKNPLLFYCFLFSVFFAFIVGLTTSNFGALVRFKIPLIPFLVGGLFIIEHLWKTKKY
jgi:hypothetical protein